MTEKRSSLEGWEVNTSDIEEIPTEENDYVGTEPTFTDKLEELFPYETEDEQECLGTPDYSMVDDDNNALTGSGEVTIKIDDEEPVTYSFDIPEVPGADIQDEIEPAELVIEEPDDIVVEEDPMSWSLQMFPQWLHGMLGKIPRHSGRDTVGIERAIAYMEFLDREISKAVRSDLKGELPIDDLADARKNIQDGIDRLKKRYDDIAGRKSPKGKKKKSDENNSLVKEGKAASFTVVVPLFISSVARTCINSMVSAGKDIEECFHKISKEYDLTKREQAELMQLLSDMNYPVRRPRMHPLDEEIDITSTDNLDWSANYHS